MEARPGTPPDAAPGSAPPEPPPRRRRALRLAAALLLPVAALLGLGAWLGTSEAGLRTVVRLAGWASDGALTVEGARGRLLGILHADAIRYRTPDLRIDIHDAALSWRPAALLEARLQVDRLAAARVEVGRRVSTEPAATPDAPASLILPLALELGRVELGAFVLRELEGAAADQPAAVLEEATEAVGDPAEAADTTVDQASAAGFRFTDLSASLASDGRAHRIHYLLLTLPPGRAVLAGSLGGGSPFALDAEAAFDGRVEGRDLRLRAVLANSLLAPVATIAAEGEGLEAHAEIEAAPFEPRPFRRVRFAAGELDPALFVAGAPRAALRLEAELAAPAEGEALLAGPLRLDNLRPATTDAGGLPLESLAGRLEWRADEIGLDALDLRLPGKGRIRGRVAWRPPGSADDGASETNAANEGKGANGVNGANGVAADARETTGAVGGPVSPEAAGQAGADGPQSAFGQLVAALELADIDPALLDARLPSQPVAGRLEAEADAGRQRVKLALGIGAARIDAEGELRAAAPAAARRFTLSALLHDVDPRALWATAPSARLNLDLQASGELPAGGLPQSAQLAFRIPASRFEDRPLAGEGQLELAGERLARVALKLDLAGNRLRADGAWGGRGDRLAFMLDAPALAALGYGLAGRARAEGTLTGSLATPGGELKLSGEGLRLPGELGLAGIDGAGRLDPGAEGRFSLSLVLRGLAPSGAAADGAPAPAWIERARLTAEGTRAAHRVELGASGLEDDRLTLRLAGGLREVAEKGGEAAGAPTGGPHWVGRVLALETAGRFPTRLLAPAALELSPTRLSLAAAVLDAGERGRIRLEETRWSPTESAARGSLTGLTVDLVSRPARRAADRPRRSPGPLVLGADWDLRVGDTLAGEARVFREAGDLTVEGEIRTRLGLEALEARLSARGDRLELALQARGSEFGTLEGAAALQAERGADGGWRIAREAPLNGSARLDMPSISWLGRLMRENVETAGRLAGEFSFAGSVANPLASGRLAGRELQLALIDQGLLLSGGELDLSFDRDRLNLDRLAFVSPNRVQPRKRDLPVNALTRTPGTFTASGGIALGSGEGRFDFAADRLPLLQRPDRWMIVSGEGEARSTWTSLVLEADFRADAGYIEFAESPPPSLSDDVVVLGREEEDGGGFALTADVRVRLGDALYLSALGLETRLAGELHLRQRPGLPLAAVGSVATVGGVYRGYGQNLTIDRGLVNFQGPLDAPGLNIVALRKGLAVEAGVAVSGTARRPQVKLVSEPNVPDPEKLSWLVLGRAPDAAAGADLGLLLPAAQALLGGSEGGMTDQLSRSLGLDTFSIGRGELGSTSRTATSRVVAGGSTITSGPTVAGDVLSLGKRLGSDLFLSFEQSLGGAETLVKLSYQISRRVSLIARGGTDSSLDLQYSFSFR